MAAKILSFLASFLMLFSFLFPPEPEINKGGDILKEQKPVTNPLRTFDEINGVNGSVFYIERPSPSLRTVSGAEFGLDSGCDDNFPQLLSAVAYLKANPGTRLLLESGRYYLNNTSTITLSGVKDVLIDGGGAVLVFSNVITGIELSGCDCVEFKNIKFDWDWDKLPLSDVATVKNADKSANCFDFVFNDSTFADENMIFSAVSQCDPETFTYGAKYSNKEHYVYQDPSVITSVRNVGGNVLRVTHNGSFDAFEDGETYIIRHYVYDSTFMVLNGESKNITFDEVSLFGYPGAGFYAGGKANHFQIINSFIGADPEKAGTRHTSLGADAIHIVNSDGCFNISGNDISGQGDDALNVHDGLGCVEEVNGREIRLTGNAILIRPGESLGFFDAGFEKTDVTAKIVADKYDGASACHTITFDRDVSGEIKSGYIAYCLDCMSDNYVVRGNYFHENRARGLLLQSPNGLCEDNRFYKTEMQAIKVIMDITHGLWYEGTGVDSLTIRGNTFEMCDVIATGEVITVGTNIDGKRAGSQPFTNIEISGNTFTEFPCRVLNCDNAASLAFTGNKIDPGTVMPQRSNGARAYFGKYCSGITFGGNEWQNCPLGTVAKTETPALYARINSKNSVEE